MSARQKAVRSPEGAEASGSVHLPDASMAAAYWQAAADAHRQAAVAAAAAADASRAGTAPQFAHALEAIEAVERAVYLHHPYENRERLRSVLPLHIDPPSLDRVLEYLERSGRIAIDGESIRWVSGQGAGGAGCEGSGAAPAGKSILAGTRFAWVEDGKLPTETIGEYVVRVSNAHEPGSYTAEDAREMDDSMRRVARGESYTHEQVWKEFGL